MSYLLDALKQSQQTDMSAEQYDLQSEQLKQQQALTRYRRLALVFGTSLAAFIVVAGGFATGKWLQSESVENITTTTKIQAVPVKVASEKEPKTLDKSDSNTQSPLQDVTQKTVQQQAPQQIVNNQTLQGQLVFVQTPNGVQQMLLTPQGQYMPMAPNQGNVAPTRNQQVYNSQAYGSSVQANQQGYSQANPNQQSYQQQTQSVPELQYNQPQNNQPQYNQPQYNQSQNNQQQNIESAQLDMSKYKVLGRQLSNKQNTVNDPELDAVPNKLKDAFAQAVQETQESNDYEVTQGTHHSSRVRPVELLPDGLQIMLPPIKYQAHIYSSSNDKRWIKLNGRELHEGESIGALTVQEITPEQSVLDFDGYEFSLKALQDWPE